MPGHPTTTAFVTQAAGFLGTELVEVLVARGHRVVGLVPSTEAAERVCRAGAVAVIGDTLEPPIAQAGLDVPVPTLELGF